MRAIARSFDPDGTLRGQGSLSLHSLHDDADGLVIRLSDPTTDAPRMRLSFSGVEHYRLTDESRCRSRENEYEIDGDCILYEVGRSNLIGELGAASVGIPLGEVHHWLVITDNEWIDVVAKSLVIS